MISILNQLLQNRVFASAFSRRSLTRKPATVAPPPSVGPVALALAVAWALTVALAVAGGLGPGRGGTVVRGRFSSGGESAASGLWRNAHLSCGIELDVPL